MKRRWIITLIVIPLVVGLVLVLKYWPRTLDDGECSALYRSYLGRTGIRSTFIKGKSLNDTLRIDLTLLQATTADGWAQLQKDFDIPEPDSTTAALLQEGNPDIILSLLNDECGNGSDGLAPSQDNAFLPVDIAVASRALQCVSIFHACTREQFDIIVDNHIEQLTTTTQTRPNDQ